MQCSSSAAAEQQPSSDDDDDGNGNLNPAFNGRAMLLWAAVGWAGSREKGGRGRGESAHLMQSRESTAAAAASAASCTG